MLLTEDFAFRREYMTPEYLAANVDGKGPITVRTLSALTALRMAGVRDVILDPPKAFCSDLLVALPNRVAIVGRGSHGLLRAARREYSMEFLAVDEVNHLPEGGGYAIVLGEPYFGEMSIGLVEGCLSLGWKPFVPVGAINYFPGLVEVCRYEDALENVRKIIFK